MAMFEVSLVRGVTQTARKKVPPSSPRTQYLPTVCSTNLASQDLIGQVRAAISNGGSLPAKA
jgi:hypothetical protein